MTVMGVWRVIYIHSWYIGVAVTRAGRGRAGKVGGKAGNVAEAEAGLSLGYRRSLHSPT
jgi:hypothetical protein